MDLSNKKIISIGGGCFSNVLLTRLDKLTGQSIRVPGPIDNLRSIHGINSSLKLFDGSLEEQFLGKDAKWVESPKAGGKQPFDEIDIEFTFDDFVIVHNDYRTSKYKDNLKKRFNNFYDFYEKSLTDENYLYIYTLCKYDRKSLGRIKIIQAKLKELGILDKVIFIGSAIAPVSLENIEPSNTVKWPDFNWPEWQEVFGDKYIIIRNANYYDEAARLFLEKLKKM